MKPAIIEKRIAPFYSKGMPFLFLLVCSTPLVALAQRPVPVPVNGLIQKRKVVLEQFTGINCAACPNGHRIADSLQAVKPAGSVFIVNIPTGPLSVPNGVEPDFRSMDGNDIATLPGMNIPFYPSGSVNRQRFPNTTGFAQNPYQWSNSMDTVQSENSSHNIALYGYIDVNTRKLVVYTEVLAQVDAPAIPTRHLTVMLLEDSVSGPQLGASQYPGQISSADSSYKHNHLLRKIISPPFTPSATGVITYPATMPGLPPAIISSQYNYTIPTQYVNNPAVLGNLRVIAFLSYGNSHIITAATGPLLITGFNYSIDAQLMPEVQIEKEVCNATLKPIVRIYNNSRSPIRSATLESSLNGGPFLPAGNFSGTIMPAGSTRIAIPPISFAPNDTNEIKFKIVNINGTPDPNPANDTLTVSNILRTTRASAGIYQVMRFTQDRYGAESTWKIVEEATGTVKLSGGPYPNLNGAGTLLHTDSFAATGETCYEIIVADKQANGINNGSGQGKYEVLSNGTLIYSSNGVFGSRNRATYKTKERLVVPPAGIAETGSFENTVRLAPNPTAGESNLVFTLAKGTRASVQVIDMTGRVVAQIAEQNLSAGTHALPISTENLAGGVYNIRLATAEGVVTRRLVVVK